MPRALLVALSLTVLTAAALVARTGDAAPPPEAATFAIVFDRAPGQWSIPGLVGPTSAVAHTVEDVPAGTHELHIGPQVRTFTVVRRPRATVMDWHNLDRDYAGLPGPPARIETDDPDLSGIGPVLHVHNTARAEVAFRRPVLEWSVPGFTGRLRARTGAALDNLLPGPLDIAVGRTRSRFVLERDGTVTPSVPWLGGAGGTVNVENTLSVRLGGVGPLPLVSVPGFAFARVAGPLDVDNLLPGEHDLAVGRTRSGFAVDPAGTVSALDPWVTAGGGVVTVDNTRGFDVNFARPVAFFGVADWTSGFAAGGTSGSFNTVVPGEMDVAVGTTRIALDLADDGTVTSAAPDTRTTGRVLGVDNTRTVEVVFDRPVVSAGIPGFAVEGPAGVSRTFSNLPAADRIELAVGRVRVRFALDEDGTVTTVDPAAEGGTSRLRVHNTGRVAVDFAGPAPSGWSVPSHTLLRTGPGVLDNLTPGTSYVVDQAGRPGVGFRLNVDGSLDRLSPEVEPTAGGIRIHPPGTDVNAPEISILVLPDRSLHLPGESLRIFFGADDLGGTGVARVAAELDGIPVASGDVLDAADLRPGDLVLRVEAEDNGGRVRVVERTIRRGTAEDAGAAAADLLDAADLDPADRREADRAADLLRRTPLAIADVRDALDLLHDLSPGGRAATATAAVTAARAGRVLALDALLDAGDPEDARDAWDAGSALTDAADPVSAWAAGRHWTAVERLAGRR